MFNYKRQFRSAISALVLGSAVVAVGSTTASAQRPSTAAVAAQASTSPSGEAMPVGDLPGWKQIFTDDFTTNVPLGSFPAAVSSKWSAYPSPWKDTSGNGTYSPSTVVSVANGIMNSDIHTDNGVAMVSAMTPKLPTSMLYGRYSVRYRFDSLPGYKMAWMLWPDSNDNKTDGEVDFPEMNLDTNTAWAYDHRTDSTGTGDQAWFNTPLTPGGWHTATIEWSPNLVVYSFDGTEIGRTWERTPDTPMHWILQTETSLTSGTAPAANVRGNVQVDWVAAYSYDPSTADTTAPTVTDAAPADGATVSGNTDLSATVTDDRAVIGVQFQVDGKNVGSEVTSAPYTTPWNTKLVADGAHTVTVVARDLAGNLTNQDANVTVSNGVDSSKPVVTSTVPVANGTIFPVGANVYAQFNEAVTGVSASSFQLTNTVTGAVIPAVIGYTLTASQSTASLNPTANLTNDTKYTVSLTNGITDSAGNPLDAYSWTFVTGPQPTATVTAPAANATNVSRSTSVTAKASEDLTRVGLTTVLLTNPSGVKVAATVTFNSSTDTVSLVPSSALAANTKYTVSLTTGIKDVVGNPLKALTWTFTTGS